MTIETELPAVKAEESKVNGIIRKLSALMHAFDMKGTNRVTMLRAINTISSIDTTEIDRLRRENEHFTKSGIIEVAVRNISVSDYMNHWEGRALAAESRCEELVKALEEAERALKPLADAVFNDNGDMTVSLSWLPSSEECIAAYFAEKHARAALKELGKGDGR